MNEEYIIIGHANSEPFRDTLTPVCATIDEDGSVITFTYSADTLKTKDIIDLKDAIYIPEFASLPTTKQSVAVQKAVFAYELKKLSTEEAQMEVKDEIWEPGIVVEVGIEGHMEEEEDDEKGYYDEAEEFYFTDSEDEQRSEIVDISDDDVDIEG